MQNSKSFQEDTGFAGLVRSHSNEFDIAAQTKVPMIFMDKRDLTDYRRDVIDLQDDLLTSIRQTVNSDELTRKILLYRFLTTYRHADPRPASNQGIAMRQFIDARVASQIDDIPFAKVHHQYQTKIFTLGQGVAAILAFTDDIKLPDFSPYTETYPFDTFHRKFYPEKYEEKNE